MARHLPRIEEIRRGENIDLEARAAESIDDVHSVEPEVVGLTEPARTLARARDRGILVRDPSPGWQRNLNHEPATRSKNPIELSDCLAIAGNVLEHMTADHCLEAAIHESQTRDVHPQLRQRASEISRDDMQIRKSTQSPCELGLRGEMEETHLPSIQPGTSLEPSPRDSVPPVGEANGTYGLRDRAVREEATTGGPAYVARPPAAPHGGPKGRAQGPVNLIGPGIDAMGHTGPQMPQEQGRAPLVAVSRRAIPLSAGRRQQREGDVPQLPIRRLKAADPMPMKLHGRRASTSPRNRREARELRNGGGLRAGVLMASNVGERVALELPAPVKPDHPRVSVILPCLNEAAGVGVCVEKARLSLEEMDLEYEILVVDNGSTDGSPEIAREAGARLVHERRRGYGAAYLRGLREATGDLIVIGDADDTYDFLDIPRFLEPLIDGQCNFVIGSRFDGEIEPGAMPWSHRYIGNPILSGLLRLLFDTTVSDSHCGMRAFTREAIDRMRLRTTGMEFASEMVVNALREKLEIREVPIVYHPRKGESKLNGMSDAWRHIRFLLVFSPSYLFRLPGLLLAGLGAIMMLALAGGPIEAFGRVWDHHTLLFGSLAVVLGYNLFIFDTLAKVFSIGAGLASEDRWLSAGLRVFTLERGLLLGLGLFAVGLGLEIKITYDWLQAGAGPLSAVRGVAIGMTAMVLGAQTAFASFLISLLLLKHR